MQYCCILPVFAMYESKIQEILREIPYPEPWDFMYNVSKYVELKQFIDFLKFCNRKY